MVDLTELRLRINYSNTILKTVLLKQIVLDFNLRPQIILKPIVRELYYFCESNLSYFDTN